MVVFRPCHEIVFPVARALPCHGIRAVTDTWLLSRQGGGPGGGLPTLAGPRVVCMIANQRVVLLRYGRHTSGRRGLGHARPQERQLALDWRVEQLASDFPGEDFSDEGRHSVSKHPLHLGTADVEPQAVRESLNAR